jgi:DNA ligase (NAD+)
LQPVQLAGTVVKRATLHNEDIIATLGLRIGDMVFIEKGGEIIPKITGVDLEKRSPDSMPIAFVTSCPECGSSLVRTEGESAWYCPNDDDCPPQMKGKLEHFISRKAMNIDSLGEGKIEMLFDNGLVRTYADLYDLTFDRLLGLEKTYESAEDKKEKKISFREKTVENILKGLEESKRVRFDKVLFALGIRFVGETVARKLAAHFGSIDKLAVADLNSLIEVDEIGEKIAQSVLAWFADSKNLGLLARLKSAGLNFMLEEPLVARVSSKLEGLTFVVSGVFNQFSRDELKKNIEAHGGKNAGSISAKTSFLLAGDNMGPEKRKKAEKLRVPVMSESEYIALTS